MKINIKNIRLKTICATLFISLFLSCNNGIEELQKEKDFLSSMAKLGNDFLDVFTSFGDFVGDALGFPAVKSGDKKSAVGEYFKKVKKELEDTNENLKRLLGEIANLKHADDSTIKVVRNEIEGASCNFKLLIEALAKLSGVTNDSSTDIGDNADDANKAADKS